MQTQMTDEQIDQLLSLCYSKPYKEQASNIAHLIALKKNRDD